MAFRSNTLALGLPGHPERPISPLPSSSLPQPGCPGARPMSLCGHCPHPGPPSQLFLDCSITATAQGPPVPAWLPGGSTPERAQSLGTHWLGWDALEETPLSLQSPDLSLRARAALCPTPRHPQSCASETSALTAPCARGLGVLANPPRPIRVPPGPPQASLPWTSACLTPTSMLSTDKGPAP